MSARDELRKFITDLAVVRGELVVSPDATSDRYLDMRRLTLGHRVAPSMGKAINEPTAEREYGAAGGLATGADPAASATTRTLSRPPGRLVARKADKVKGLQRRIEGPSVGGRKVLAAADVNTTGSSVLPPSRQSARRMPRSSALRLLSIKARVSRSRPPDCHIEPPIRWPTLTCRPNGSQIRTC